VELLDAVQELLFFATTDLEAFLACMTAISTISSSRFGRNSWSGGIEQPDGDRQAGHVSKRPLKSDRCMGSSLFRAFSRSSVVLARIICCT